MKKQKGDVYILSNKNVEDIANGIELLPSQQESSNECQFFLRTQNSQNHAQKLDLNNPKDIAMLTSKPTVFCLSGNATIDEKSANGFCKIVQNYLRLMFNESTPQPAIQQVLQMEKTINIVGVSYAPDKRNKFSSGTGRIPDETVDELVDKVFLPMCLDKFGNLDVKIAKKNLSQVVFFSFCHGALEVQKISANLLNKLVKIHQVPTKSAFYDYIYSFSQISFAPSASSIFPSVEFFSVQDNTILDAIFFEEISGKKIDGIEFNISSEIVQKDKKYKARTLQVFSSKLLNNSSAEINEHRVDIVSRGENWENEISCKDGSFKKLHPNADVVSQLISWSLCSYVENAIQNHNSSTFIPKPHLEDLKQDFQSILDLAKDDVQNKNSNTTASQPYEQSKILF